MALIALNQLFEVLVQKPEPEKITPLEESTIANCNFKIFCISGFASGVGGGLGWQVAKRLKIPKPIAFTLAAGVATVSLSAALQWASSTTAVSCLDHILSQDATRMQKELVNVLVTSNQGEAWRWKLMSRYFYPEAVYGDEGDKPQMRWRRRSTFTELVVSYDDGKDATHQRNNNALPNRPNRIISSQGSDSSKTRPLLQNRSGNQDGEENALDIIFGGSEPAESIPAPTKSKVSVKTQTRKQKRAKRRQRIKNREASSDTPQYELA